VITTKINIYVVEIVHVSILLLKIFQKFCFDLISTLKKCFSHTFTTCTYTRDHSEVSCIYVCMYVIVCIAHLVYHYHQLYILGSNLQCAVPKLRINGFVDFVHHLVFWKLENATFQKLNLFPPSRWRGKHLLCWVLERANLNHETTSAILTTAEQTPETRFHQMWN
jgi:hypothetical protein